MQDARQYICDLEPYFPGLPSELVAREYGVDPKRIVKLASNENPLGMSPKAQAVLERLLPEGNRYPEQYSLLQALAKKLKVGPECLTVGNGSNDVLDLVGRTFLAEGCEAISPQYAFAVYIIITQSTGATNVVIPAKDYGHDLEAMLAAITPKTRVIWLVNPNNPTGTFVPYPEVKQFLDKVPERIIVVLDEAYHEYLDEADRTDTLAWLKEYPNLVLTRTFSKAYGLAGVRVGYSVSSSQIAELLNRVRQPFNVSRLALAAAEAALDDDEFLQETRRINNAGRKQIQVGLTQLGLEYLPAYGNFVAFRVSKAAETNEKLLRQGVIIRPLAGYGMTDWLRVTIGTAEENRRFLQALQGLTV